MSAEIPYFVKVRGCINCDASTRLKEKTGHDYGFDHELVSRCVVLSCKRLGYDLAHPFIDPVEIFRMVEQIGTPGARLRGRELLSEQESQFGRFFEELGVSIKAMLDKLGPVTGDEEEIINQRARKDSRVF